MKEFNSQICTTKGQSQRLLELGLEPKTADCMWCAVTKDAKGREIPYKNIKWYLQAHTSTSKQIVGFMEYTHIPAWSLHRLLCMLDYDNADTFNIMPNLAYEDVIATISLRINCGAFNKEYLNK